MLAAKNNIQLSCILLLLAVGFILQLPQQKRKRTFLINASLHFPFKKKKMQLPCNKTSFPRITWMTGEKAHAQYADDNRICAGGGAA